MIREKEDLLHEAGQVYLDAHGAGSSELRFRLVELAVQIDIRDAIIRNAEALEHRNKYLTTQEA